MKPCKLGFASGDIVWTPMRRKAVLTHYHVAEERWLMRYVGESKHIGGLALQAKLLTPLVLPSIHVLAKHD